MVILYLPKRGVKKTAAILLLIMLFFNWYGYRIVMDILAAKADTRLEARIDNQEYAEEDLVEISIPLNIPYQINQPEFERHYGEVEIDGQVYSYVKRKVENGFLVLKCIPNESRQDIEQGGNEFFKKANGLDHSQPEKNSSGNQSFAKGFFGECDDRNDLPGLQAFSTSMTQNYGSFTAATMHTSLTQPGKPPRLNA